MTEVIPDKQNTLRVADAILAQLKTFFKWYNGGVAIA